MRKLKAIILELKTVFEAYISLFKIFYLIQL